MSDVSKRGIRNIRLKSNDPGYAPHRDLAYVYPAMMREAFFALDEVNWSTELKARLHSDNITEADLSVAVGQFTDALNMFIRHADITTPVAAFDKTGFNAQPYVIKQTLYARFGEVLTGGWFIAVKDVTLAGRESDAACDIAAMLAAGKAVARLMMTEFPTTLYAAVVNEEEVAAELDGLRHVITQLQEENKKLKTNTVQQQQQKKPASSLLSAVYSIIQKVLPR
jgi:hypothetical protein